MTASPFEPDASTGSEQPPSPPSHPRVPFGEKPGDFIGPYKLLELIGEGGFGVVWLAERRKPMVQRVAIKIIKPGMDSKAVIARFEQERQALAVMDHPNVAKVLDGGTTSTGRPYFVMEYVKGEPITDFCDRHNLNITERLELFMPVCEAVQHAHTKGLIHRDLKPTNILVSAPDVSSSPLPTPDSPRMVPGSPLPVPKVIDFGVAKAISHTLTDKTIFTEQGQIIGTPEYMSPEQAEMSAVDIDTRTDVYSLGVVLYELLSGLLPFDSATLRSKGYAEIQRIIREVDPPKPSTRLTAIAHTAPTTPDAAFVPSARVHAPSPPDAAPAPSADACSRADRIARVRQTRLHDLTRQLRRELDWIPLKAMRKDRRERYRTPADLADDIRRYLDGRPLSAGPVSTLYRLRKFARRNKGALAAVAALALFGGALSLGGPMVARQVRRARELEQEKRQLQALIDNEASSRSGYQEPMEDRLVRVQLSTRKVSLDAKAEPLEGVLRSLELQSGVRLNVDWNALEAERIDRGTPVSVNLTNVSLESALGAVIAPLGYNEYDRPIMCVVRDGAVLLSTILELRRTRSVVVYDIREVLEKTGEQGDEAIDAVHRLIINYVDPESWIEYGGDTGNIEAAGQTLVIQQSPEGHRAIGKLLALLRAGGVRGTDEAAPGQELEAGPSQIVGAEAQELVLRRLHKAVGPVDFADTSLETAFKALSERAGVAFNIDWKSLEQERISQSMPIQLTMPECSVFLALNVILDQVTALGLGGRVSYDVLENGLLITSESRASSMRKTVFYDMEPLLRTTTGPGADPAEVERRLQTIVSGMTETVDPEGWVDNGGDRGRTMQLGHSLMINNTLANHLLIREYFTALMSPYRLYALSREEGPDARAGQSPARASDRDREALRRLRETKGKVDFAGTPLEDALRTLVATAGLGLTVDWPSLPEEARTIPIDLQISECSVEAALALLLGRIGGLSLGIEPLYDLVEGGVLVTAGTPGEGIVRWAVFDIAPLLTARADAVPAPGERELCVRSIMESLQVVVDPDGWADYGGTRGTMRILDDRLIVRTTGINIIRIEEVLDQLVSKVSPDPNGRTPAAQKEGDASESLNSAIERGAAARTANDSRGVLRCLMEVPEEARDWKWRALRYAADESAIWLPCDSRWPPASVRVRGPTLFSATWNSRFQAFDLNHPIARSRPILDVDQSIVPWTGLTEADQPLGLDYLEDSRYLMTVQPNGVLQRRPIPAPPFWGHSLSPDGKWVAYYTERHYGWGRWPVLHFLPLDPQAEPVTVHAPDAADTSLSTKWSGDGSAFAARFWYQPPRRSPPPDVEGPPKETEAWPEDLHGPPRPPRYLVWRAPDWRQVGEVPAEWLSDTQAEWNLDGSGTRLAAQSDGRIMVCNVDTGRVISVFSGEAGAAKTFGLSFDGAILATGHDDGDVRLWDVQSLQQRRTFSVRNRKVRSLLFHPDKHRLIAWYSDGIARVWEEIGESEPRPEQVAKVTEESIGLLEDWRSRTQDADMIGTQVENDRRASERVRRQAMMMALDDWLKQRQCVR